MEMKRQSEFAKNILFTGAGFTKNFGGLLAEEMWSKIFNNKRVQDHTRLMELLKTDFNYESIYHQVINGNYTDEEKASINTAIIDSYKILDDIVRKWTFSSGSPYPVNIYGVNGFIERFVGNHETGLFFTLNQDLFIERHFNSVMVGLNIPGVAKIPDNHKTIIQLPLENDDFKKLPTDDDLNANPINLISSRTLNYIKLHGSFGWLSSAGTHMHVIGRQKERLISEEPLLSWYFSLFKEALFKPNRKLFVIGYGFMDRHINGVIADSINDFNLKLYVMSPSNQLAFFDKLNSIEHGGIIHRAVVGYFPYKLLDIFPQNKSESHAWREIIGSYFEN
ncbi:MAG: SIR2 family protein [Desulfomonile tiedjei]|nr:SIR2 family protein [Desulfomonile tiedjei]